ncbi:MAG: hypothetical protein AABW87_01435, partial [Nanoarchaeota archaeon]
APSYMWNASNNESSSCGANLSATIASVTNTHARVCSNLTFGDAGDELIIEIFLNLSSDTSPGIEYKDDGLQIRGEDNIP